MFDTIPMLHVLNGFQKDGAELVAGPMYYDPVYVLRVLFVGVLTTRPYYLVSIFDPLIWGTPV